MISQRNISLLPNRLAKAGGRRISEMVLRTDYCQITLGVLLFQLCSDDMLDILVWH